VRIGAWAAGEKCHDGRGSVATGREGAEGGESTTDENPALVTESGSDSGVPPPLPPHQPTSSQKVGSLAEGGVGGMGGGGGSGAIGGMGTMEGISIGGRDALANFLNQGAGMHVCVCCVRVRVRVRVCCVRMPTRSTLNLKLYTLNPKP